MKQHSSNRNGGAVAAPEDGVALNGLYRELFAHLSGPVILFLLPQEGSRTSIRLLDLNPSALHLLQLDPARLSLADLPGYLSHLFDLEHRCLYRQAAQRGETVVLGELSLAAQGKESIFSVAAVPLSALRFALMLQDITRVRQAETALADLRQLSNKLHTLDAERLLDAFIHESVRLLHAESGVAGFCTPQGVSSYRYLVKGEPAPPEVCWEPGHPLPCRMLLLEHPYIAHDALQDPHVNAELATKYGVKSAIGNPIYDLNGELIGFVELHNKLAGDRFSEMDQQELASLAHIAATAMKNAQTFQKAAQMERSLRESEARFRSMYESASLGIAVIDRHGRLRKCNPALRRLLGFNEEELGQMLIFELDHQHELQQERLLFQEVMSGEKALYHVDKELTRKDGSLLWARVTISTVRDSKGVPVYAIGTVDDATERHEAELAVAALLAKVRQDAADLERRVAERTAQLEESNRELEAFAYSVSHDLRAPLRAVQGYTEILLEEHLEQLPEAGREMLQRIVAAAHRMNALIQDLLSYSRVSRQDIFTAPIRLQKVVEEALAHLRQENGGRSYRVELSGELPEVLGHQAVLTQVVLNLLTNAVKFVAAGVEPKIRIWWEQRGGNCRLLIRDNGIGIAPQHLERIFKIFERLHGMEEYPGTGVGLAIAQKGVLRMGGQIGAFSTPGEGSTFWIELPLAAPVVRAEAKEGGSDEL